jgi:hypothetical protein
MEITLENIYYLFGVLFIVLSIYSKVFKKQKNVEFEIDVMDEAIKNTSEIISDKVKIAKNHVKLLDFIEATAYLLWMIIGVFTKHKILFCLLLFSSFILPVMQSFIFKGNKIKVSISTDKTKKLDIINFVISAVIIFYIEYHHFFTNNIK